MNQKIGINLSSPNASLNIKELTCCQGNDFTTLLKFQSTNTSVNSTYYWDLRMEQTSNLSFWQQTNSGSKSKVLSLYPGHVQVFNRLVVGDFGDYGAGLAPDNSQGYYLSLGLKQMGVLGAWQGSGVTMFTTNSGEFQLMTNSSGIVNGASNMLNQVRFMVHHTGVSVNTTNLPTGYALAVDGDAIFNKVVIKTTNTWPDYVFAKNYNLRSLTEVKAFITQNGHLPDVPSSKQVEEHGVNVAEMNVILLKKVEELTLYLMEFEERLAKMESKQ